MMYPNPNFLTYFPDAELPTDEGRTERSSCLRVGTFIVLEKLMMESMLDKIVSSIYNDYRGTGLFLDLASYYLITENNEELMNAVINSDRSYEEIMAFVKGETVE